MKESLNLYRILIIVFLCIGSVLIYMNVNIIKNTYSIETSTSNTFNVNETNVKKYGYTDILSMLNQYANLEILNISCEVENNDIINIDIKYNSTLEEFNNTLEKIKAEPYFVSIKKIKIDKTNNDIQDTNFTAVFLKNR